MRQLENAARRRGARVDEMEIEACIVGLTEALQIFPDVSRFRKAFVFTDSMYVKENFVRAMNIWPQQAWKGARGVRVENVELWKRLRKIVASFPIRVEVEWVKGHKTSVHNRAAAKLAKQSAAMPFNRPLSVSQTASKWSDQKTLRGFDPDHASFKCVDFVRFHQPLSRHKCLLVRLNSDRASPRIEQVVEELDPAQMRDAWQKRAV